MTSSALRKPTPMRTSSQPWPHRSANAHCRVAEWPVPRLARPAGTADASQPLGDGDAEGQRVDTAARRSCVAVPTSPMAVATAARALTLGLAVRFLTSPWSLVSADFSAAVCACHWPCAASTKAVSFVLTSVRSAVISFFMPFCTLMCVSCSSEANRASASSHNAEFGDELAVAGADEDAEGEGEGAPDVVPPDAWLLLLELHAAVSSARPPTSAASRHRAGLVMIPPLMTLPAFGQPGRRRITRSGSFTAFRART